MIGTKQLLAAAAAVAFGVASAHAATFTSSTFASSSSATNFDVSGDNVVDWGYYNHRGNFQGTPTPDNTKEVSGIGDVTITPGAIATGTVGAYPNNTFAFTDGTSPTTSVGIDNLPSQIDDVAYAGARFGAWGTTETNGFTIVFNDLGVGTHTVRLIAGHSLQDGGAANSRSLRVNYDVTATDGNLSGSSDGASVSGDVIHGTYTLVFSTTDANADVTLSLDSLTAGTGNGAGSGWISGYIVETVPEPSSLALLALGGLLIARRRHNEGD